MIVSGQHVPHSPSLVKSITTDRIVSGEKGGVGIPHKGVRHNESHDRTPIHSVNTDVYYVGGTAVSYSGEYDRHVHEDPPHRTYIKAAVINSTGFRVLFCEVNEHVTRDPLNLSSRFKNPCLTTFQRQAHTAYSVSVPVSLHSVGPSTA